MIQRIQTVFLLLVAALAAALFFFPVFIIKTPPTGSAVVDITYSVQSNPFVAIVVALTGLIAFISIFLYGNRKRQIMLCRLNLLFIIGAWGLIFQASDSSSFVKPGEQISIEYYFPIYLPLVQIVLDLLAIRFIKKDDDLVRSADRLR